MRLAHLIGPEIHDLLRDNPEDVRELLDEIHPEDLADVVLELDDDEAGALLQRLAPDAAADIFERLPEGRQEALVNKIGLLKAARIATEMSADDRADLFSALPDNVGEKLLETLEKYDPEAAEEVEELTRWPETSAGHLMTTDYIETHRDATAEDAIKEVRRQGEDVELIHYVYVVDPQDRLIGIASLRDILLADPTERIDEIMVENVISVTPETDQEQVAKLMAKYDMQAVPVVDGRGEFHGIITIDDIVDVMTEEQTEDVHKLGGVQPIENPYFDTTTWTFIKKRGVWLMVLFLGEMFTGTALRHFDHVIESVAQLSYYVPLLISTGGNSGGQSSTLIIRGLAVGEIQMGDWYRVLVREMVQGVVLGLILALVGAVRVLLWGDGWNFAVLIGAALVAISIMGCTIGGMLPLMIKRVGLDPATSSTPFIASLVDVFGILIYFGLAQVILARVIAQAGH
ncbi:MAG TPA: magnesium transporter [Polyangiaceae bacterium]|jgi:magnesium transporter|nr:MAG: Magnesium transporter MgtE [Deltaproteobacteria bacterium ADurb.Bin207]HNS95480.1 magnesium transporter [Polyangiaceae bacterium]HNZ20580.1 magnesium transporter [Polyangiaceae bacterium]HOD20804.1 magnesium transporter [Polyangiaceae bacterium]HOE47224.1 magnesium transporter [Polyangiaceae bacterium]